MVNAASFVKIPGWIANDENLSKSEMLIFSIIHGFSIRKRMNDFDEPELILGKFDGSINHLVEWSKYSRSTVIRMLKSLCEKSYIKKEVRYRNNQRFCAYYSTISRNTELVEELENSPSKTENRNPFHDDVPVVIKMTHPQCQNNMGDGATMAHNNLENNLVNNTAAEITCEKINTTDVSNSEQKGEDSESPLVLKKQKAAAAHLKTKIISLFNKNIFDSHFIPEVSKIIADSAMTEGQIEDYVQFVYDKTISKKPSSVANMFRSLMRGQDVLFDYILTHKTEKQEKKLFQKTKCPVCDNQTDNYPGICKCCGFDLADSKNKKQIAIERKIFRLPADVRKSYEAEIDDVYKTYGFVIRPDLIEKQQEKLNVINSKYGITE